MNREQIISEIKTVVVDCLNADEKEITLESRLAADLGAESIDFLDLTFRLERAFNIRINGDLFPTDLFKDLDGCVENGRVTAKGIDLLESKIPFANFSEWAKNPQYSTITDSFTVGTLVRYIEMQQTIIR